MDFKDVVESRRAVNYFDTEKSVDEKTIRAIYDLAKLAPSSFNLQPWRMLLVHEPDMKQKLRECASNQPKVTEAPYVAIILGDKKAYEKMDPIIDDFVAKGYAPEAARETLKQMGAKLYGGANERAFASRNAGLFAMSFMFAAKNFGVDTHPMDGIDTAAIGKAFNIPENYEVVMLIAIGHFDETKPVLERKKRISFEEAVIKESF